MILTYSSTGARRLKLAAGALAVAGALSACNLDVSTPDVIPPASTEGAAALPTLLAGASGDFSVAYGGYSNGDNSDAIIQTSGLFTDEFIAADFFSTHVTIDSRDANPTNDIISRVMRNIQRSIVSSNNAAARYAQLAPKDPGFGRVLNFAGFDYLFLAENFCSGVPVGSIIDASGNTVYGTPKSTAELLNLAVSKFDSALAMATVANNNLMKYTAMVGKARALLDLNQPAAAATAVAGVPTSFSFTTEHDAANDRTKNGVYELTWINTRLTTADVEGQNGLPFVSSKDPRTATADLDVSQFDGATEIMAPEKYGSYTAPEVIADGIEARLIEAEAALRAGNYGGAGGTLAILNSLRTGAGLAALPTATGAQAQQNQLFNERAYWMFATAHRLGDLRRLITQYGRTADQVFPTGSYFKGDQYGTDVNLPVPQEEESNPNFKRASCDQSKA
ncbi:MAG: RagB/SusD family nutrient uptake outer membrane protein [Gemmatimonadaceae bacterium]